MIGNADESGRSKSSGSLAATGRWVTHLTPSKGRVLVIDDEEIIRDAIGLVLEEAGYEVSFAENGREALRRLAAQIAPDVIVLDLRMPVMDGWEFRAIQKDDPRLGLIPVVALSADGSGQAAAISAQAYLRKPVEAKALLGTIQRVLADRVREASARATETERLASLGRVAAAVGHEINNPLTFLMLNVTQSMDRLRPSIRALGELPEPPLTEGYIDEIRARLSTVVDMLEDCQIGCERIRDTVSNLQRLSGRSEGRSGPLNVHKLIEQSVSIAWNQIRHRAQLVRSFGTLPLINGDGTALGQVFLNLLVNAAQAVPEGHAVENEIRISTGVADRIGSAEVVVEIRDSGAGMAPDVLAHVFEPFFTTKALGQGTGLGLSISRQTVALHGGRMTVESLQGEGTVVRVFLPIGQSPVFLPAGATSAHRPVVLRGRVLVIDDEPMIGSVVKMALIEEHDVVIADSASEAITRLERGETFDLVLCDIVMPDMSGPTLYATVVERWPKLASRMVFMTGGAFTPETVGFVEAMPAQILAKPFTVERLIELARESLSRKD